MLLLPSFHLKARLKKNPLTDRDDGARFLGHGYEVVRGDQPALRMLPANQRLKPHQEAGVQSHNRLVIYEEFAPINCAAQIALELQKMNCAGVHALIKDDVPSLAEGFGLIHSRVGVAKEVLWGFVGRIRKRYPDADRCKRLISPE